MSKFGTRQKAEREVRSKCALIVRHHRTVLLDKLLQGSDVNKPCLRRVIRLLHEIEEEILETNLAASNKDITVTGDFSPEEMERALAVMEEQKNPFE